MAHESVHEAIQGRAAPDVPPDALTDTLSKKTATFVTLHLNKRLRGCVGNLVAREALYRSVMRHAIGAALRDTRFEPVSLEESSRLQIHVSMLSTLIPLRSGDVNELLEQITPCLDGVVLRCSGRSATYLPQVWTSFPKKETFLEALSKKAGLEGPAWRQAGAELLIYRVSEFVDTTVA